MTMVAARTFSSYSILYDAVPLSRTNTRRSRQKHIDFPSSLSSSSSASSCSFRGSHSSILPTRRRSKSHHGAFSSSRASSSSSSLATVLLASRRSSSASKRASSSSSSSELDPYQKDQSQGVLVIDDDGDVDPQGGGRPLSYKDLSPVGRLVAGTIEVAMVTLFEYLSGMCSGYFLGCVTDLPRLFFQPVGGGISPSSSSLPGRRGAWMQQASSRIVRTHSKAAKWGTSWAEISAVCGGMNVACRVIRGGVDDEWNSILGSMAAGAFFRRKEGPQAMLSGAIVYGGLVYLLSGGGLGGLFGNPKEPFQYKEQPVTF